MAPCSGEIAHYGAVILKSNRDAFQEECRKLEVEIAGFQQKAESQLDAAIAKNCATVCERLLPSVETKLPDRWIKTQRPLSEKNGLRRI
jgi:hypothetical protein